jgi:hypothetical protein
MTRKLLSVVCAAIAAGVLGFSQAEATPITYTLIPDMCASCGTGNATGDSVTLTGSITTDGASGALSTANILDWNLMVTFSNPLFNLDITPANSFRNASPTLLSATSAGLFFNFEYSGPLIFNAFDFNAGTSPFLAYCAAPNSVAECTGFGPGILIINNPVQGTSWGAEFSGPPLPGSDEIATATPATPLPTALPLFATGLGGLGLLGWRRKRKVQA